MIETIVMVLELTCVVGWPDFRVSSACRLCWAAPLWQRECLRFRAPPLRTMGHYRCLMVRFQEKSCITFFWEWVSLSLGSRYGTLDCKWTVGHFGGLNDTSSRPTLLLSRPLLGTHTRQTIGSIWIVNSNQDGGHIGDDDIFPSSFSARDWAAQLKVM